VKYDVAGLRTILVERTGVLGNLGRIRVRYATWVPAADDANGPSGIVAAAVVVELAPGTWVLQHLLVADDERRKGWAMRIVESVEREHGGALAALWVTPPGKAFARGYVRKHGPRPLFRLNDIGRNSDRPVPAG
jgi:hypothetical protein